MRSDIIKEGPECAPNRSLLKATGVTDSEMSTAGMLIKLPDYI